jgi:uncharacterized protein YbjT (DUF2867 family)
MNNKRIVLAGGSGLLGRLLAQYFSARNYDICVLSRNPGSNAHARVAPWDARTVGDWQCEIDGAFAVIN